MLFGLAFNLPEEQLEKRAYRKSQFVERILEIKPRLVICGHIHEARGVYRIGSTLVTNGCQVNQRYEPHADVWLYTKVKTLQSFLFG